MEACTHQADVAPDVKAEDRGKDEKVAQRGAQLRGE
jgi:hypothetical protein